MSPSASGPAGAVPPEAPKDCPLCPRLVAYREANRIALPDGFNGAVDSFGPANARLLILGLAPGVKGANYTGRPFTGDYAGELLYPTLIRHGLARGNYAARAGDGMELVGCMISNAVRCVPPQNKPTTEETNTCRQFLISRMSALPDLKAILALGKIAHDSALRALGYKMSAAKFAHGAEAVLEGPNGLLALVDSYHCSRYNTNTGRLTEPMFNEAMALAKAAAGL